MSDSLRIIFAGTPDFAASSLAALIGTEHNIVAVYTQPDRPAGRGRKLTPSPVKKLALEHDIPVYQPLNFKEEGALETLSSHQADLMVVVAYGLLLPLAVLETPRLGCINVHASLLPRWRGAAPIHRAVLAGDKETGVTIMQMDVGLDTGDMLHKVTCPIGENQSSGELHDVLADMGAQALVDTLAPLASGEITPQKQDDTLANYAHKLEKQEGNIDWTQSAETIARQVRGLSPWPVSYTQLDGKALRIWQASVASVESPSANAGEIIEVGKRSLVVACGEGALAIESLQLPGAKPLDTGSVLNAKRDVFPLGKQLGAAN
ncbi:MAG: methionyl-tRNA formyltransferase [Pontibacterium sp.]